MSATRSLYLVARYRAWSIRLPRRQFVATLACAAALLALALAALCLGDTRVAPPDLWRALTGQAPGWLNFLIGQIRLPRLLAALLVGAALGVAGLMLQTLARNRLASPDMMGINDGASFAMALTLLWSPAGLLGPWWLALTGALVTVLLILVAAGGIGSQGYRVVVVGLALANLLKAGFDLVLATLPAMHSGGLFVFSVGSLLGRGYAVALPAALGLLLLLGMLLPWVRTLGMLGLSDDLARGLGVRLPRVQLAALLIAAAMAGLAVSVAGPIGFVAIAAPIVARALAGPASLPLAAAGLMGAFMVLAADTLGRLVAAPVEIPAGVVTGMLGGPFLLWVLLGQRGRRA
ncbi:FecCD family ABC transporter permease [Chitiniphilus eburneus]|uniref:Iron ABC transporter permease n=1 Tax=Chitiniphilus eburneus TaxID=2571148 RepID=A0A4U0P8T9_9NEIS|nr:iron ABC transporter permease [Chitiniphilus eburneus]TJZ63943.1 iron ABC transporter permease [Chitiniphilus eburneus]